MLAWVRGGVAAALATRGGAQQQLLRTAGMASATTGTFQLPADTYKYHKLDAPLSLTVEASKDELLGYFESMFRMRRMEMAAEEAYAARKIRGFLHVYNGQESVLVGMESVLKRTDSVMTGYRDHCHYLARGGTVYKMIAELMGKHDGCSKGKGGSMHMYTKEGNFYGGSGIVGAQVPVGAGLAFAHKYRKDGGVGVVYYGDGAANQGQVFEAFNMASLWKLPCIFICENNRYGMGTSIQRAAANTQFYTRGDYLPGIQVEATNVLAVRNAALFARKHAVEHGPIVLEMLTYRFAGHSMSDPGTSYRSREEVEERRNNADPVEIARRLILSKEWVDPAELKAMEKRIRAEVEADVKRAEAAPLPPLAEAETDVYLTTSS